MSYVGLSAEGVLTMHNQCYKTPTTNPRGALRRPPRQPGPRLQPAPLCTTLFSFSQSGRVVCDENSDFPLAARVTRPLSVAGFCIYEHMPLARETQSVTA